MTKNSDTINGIEQCYLCQQGIPSGEFRITHDREDTEPHHTAHDECARKWLVEHYEQWQNNQSKCFGCDRHLGLDNIFSLRDRVSLALQIGISDALMGVAVTHLGITAYHIVHYPKGVLGGLLLNVSSIATPILCAGQLEKSSLLIVPVVSGIVAGLFYNDLTDVAGNISQRRIIWLTTIGILGAAAQVINKISAGKPLNEVVRASLVGASQGTIALVASYATKPLSDYFTSLVLPNPLGIAVVGLVALNFGTVISQAMCALIGDTRAISGLGPKASTLYLILTALRGYQDEAGNRLDACSIGIASAAMFAAVDLCLPGFILRNSDIFPQSPENDSSKLNQINSLTYYKEEVSAINLRAVALKSLAFGVATTALLRMLNEPQGTSAENITEAFGNLAIIAGAAIGSGRAGNLMRELVGSDDTAHFWELGSFGVFGAASVMVTRAISEILKGSNFLPTTVLQTFATAAAVAVLTRHVIRWFKPVIPT